jgi:hypothetical protein
MSTQLSPEDYLKNRVQDQIDWYDRKSGILKKRYRRMKVVTIILGVSIPVVISFSELADSVEWLKYIAGAMGAAISGLEGISGILKDKDNFLAYRATREALMREKMLYSTLSGNYAGSKDAFALFVASCESIMANEHSGWVEIFNKEEKK